MKNKNIWIMGGFGNVLFQILFALKFDRKSIQIVPVLTDKNFFTKFLKFTIHKKVYEPLFKELNFSSYSPSFLKSLFILFKSLISKKIKAPFLDTYFYPYDEVGQTAKNNINYFGYFQNKDILEKYNVEITILNTAILSVFKPQKLTREVVVHFRLGDSDWAKANLQYYDEIKKLLILEKQEITIVTDSIEEARGFFSNCNIKQIFSKSPAEDFKIMLEAVTLYTAPSTFSWWAGQFLSQNCTVIISSFVHNRLGYHGDSNLKVI
jgi:hypothetical protein